MAEDDRNNNEATEAGAGGRVTSGAEVAGDDPAGVGEGAGASAATRGAGDASEGGGEGSRPGDWNPGEQSGGGGELYYSVMHLNEHDSLNYLAAS